MNLLMLLFVAVLLVVIITMFRAPKTNPDGQQMEMLSVGPAYPEVVLAMTPRPPPLPQRRRLKPPPLAQHRAMEPMEALPVAKLASLHDVDLPVPPPPGVTRPRSANAGRLANLLKDRDTLRTAVLLREVLAHPLCKRRK